MNQQYLVLVEKFDLKSVARKKNVKFTFLCWRLS